MSLFLYLEEDANHPTKGVTATRYSIGVLDKFGEAKNSRSLVGHEENFKVDECVFSSRLVARRDLDFTEGGDLLDDEGSLHIRCELSFVDDDDVTQPPAKVPRMMSLEEYSDFVITTPDGAKEYKVGQLL